MNKDYQYEINNESPEGKKKRIRQMFDSIVPTYDLLNRLLSFGIDTIWRKLLIKIGGEIKNSSVLDLCCGTGDLSNLLERSGSNLVSLDFSVSMLKKGVKKGWLRAPVVAADVSAMPFKNESFKYLTIAFGIRNVPDLGNFLAESVRLLEPGGKLLVLELTRPSGMIVKLVYRFYLGFLLPFIGGIISGKKDAYNYLSETIKTFIDPDVLVSLMKENGFSRVEMYQKTFGIATIYECIKY